MSGAALVPREEALVAFQGDEVVAVTIEEAGELVVYVPLRPLVENLGLSWSAQFERVKRDAILSERSRSVRVTRTEGARDMLALPLSLLNGWLFGVNASRVKPEIRERLLVYQRECYETLFAYFKAKARGAIEIESLEDIRALGASLIHLADRQGAIERRVEAHAGELEEAARMIRELLAGVDKAHDRLDDAGRYVARLSGEVARLSDPGEPLSPAQRQKLKALVDEAAYLLGRLPGYAHEGRRKPYPAIWSEIHRLAGVNSYEEIRRAQFEPLSGELEAWIERMRQWVDAQEGES